MNTQQLTGEHFLLKALQLEAEGLFTEAISNYKRAYKLKPELVCLIINNITKVI